MSKFFIIILFAFISSNIFAQWSSTNGPGGGTITEFYATDEKLFTATGANAGGVYCSTDEQISWKSDTEKEGSCQAIPNPLSVHIDTIYHWHLLPSLEHCLLHSLVGKMGGIKWSDIIFSG